MVDHCRFKPCVWYALSKSPPFRCALLVDLLFFFLPTIVPRLLVTPQDYFVFSSYHQRNPISKNMDRIDKSNTNWTPWTRLSHIPQRYQVIGGVAAIMGGALLMSEFRRRVSGKLPSTISKEWEDKTEELSQGKPTESGADPLVLNPISKAMYDKKD